MTPPDLTPLRDEFARAAAGGPAPVAAKGDSPAVDTPPARSAEPAPEKPAGKGKGKRPKSDRDVDGDSIKGCAKRAGKANALRLGKALGWTEAEVEALLAPPPPPDAAPAAGGAAPPPSPPAGGGDDEPFWKPARNPIKPLPPNCPVKPLGRMGSTFYYLDPLNQLRDLAESDHSAGGIRSLFCDRIDVLWAGWPKFNEAKGNQSGWKADQASESLMHACSSRGLFDAFDRVRGLGAWRDAEGRLVLHHGDALSIDGEIAAPGEHGGYLYPAYAPGPRPAETAEDFSGLFDDFLKLIDSWNWFRPGEANATPARIGDHHWQSVACFGWIGVAMAGGALRYRPPLWVTGDNGSGKSAFLDLVMAVAGDMVKSANATQASIWSVLGPSTRAVLVDEAENDPRSPRTVRLVELARQAFSGDIILRGSSDHKAHAFQARSAFLFSSIIIPPMLGQDVARFCVLDLWPIEGKRSLKIDEAWARRVGRAMRRRLVDQWWSWEARLDAWRGTLAEQGHNARGCDVFGHILGMHDMMFSAAVAPEWQRREVCQMFPPGLQQKTTNAEDMLNLLLSVPLDVFRGGTRMTIADLVETAIVGVDMPDSEHLPEGCRKALRPWGVFVTQEEDGWRVALPNRSEGLRKLFEGSQWRTDAGATGGWAQAMKRLPGARDVNSRKFGGRAWSVPADVFLMKE